MASRRRANHFSRTRRGTGAAAIKGTILSTAPLAALPPGTSKWNKIEHRLFSFITMNWRGQPLVSHEVIVNLIASTKTRSGLRVRAELDTAEYPKGLVVSDATLSTINIECDAFHGDWNYCIRSG